MPRRRGSEDSDPNFIGGFARGLSVIEAFHEKKAKLTTADVAKITGLDRATARRCLLTLAKLGYADYDGKFFSLTPRLLRLGFAYLSSIPLPRTIQPFLQRLSDQFQETCSAAVLDGDNVVYVARVQRSGLAFGVAVGSRLPAWASSMGRVLLAALPPTEARQRIRRSQRKKLTPFTRTEIPELMTEIKLIGDQGYAFIDEELELGLRSIAIPLYDVGGKIIAAMNVGSTTSRATAEIMITRILPEMLKVQAELRRLLQ